MNIMRRSSLQVYSRLRRPQMMLPCSMSLSYSTLSEQEEKEEKDRIASLTKYEKEMELRKLNSEIARLETLRGINTGEMYTLRGKFKLFARNYGFGFMIWYYTVWTSMALLTYTAIEIGQVDAMLLIAKTDIWTGLDLSSRVDETLGTIGVTLALNEIMEPIRLALVLSTTKPVVETFNRRSGYY